MDKLDIDFETASKVDLKKVGLDVYSRHKSTHVLIMAWKLNDGPINIWLPHLGPMPVKLREMIGDKSIRKIAHNAAFEIAIFNNTLSIYTTPDQWYCTQVMALSLGLPAALAQLMRDALKTDAKYWKDPEGDRLMRLFSFPNSKATHESHPVEFAKYVEYCRQDVAAEAKAFSILKKYTPYMGTLFDEWVIDQEINANGVPVDYEFIDGALDIVDKTKAEYLVELQELTGLKKPGAWQQLLPWVRARGYPFESIKKDRALIALNDFDFEIDLDAQKALRLRMESNKTSVAKYASFKAAAVGRRVRNMFQFFGAARTGRWGGRLVQVHNLPRPGEFEKFLRELRDMILDADLESLKFYFGKPLEALSASLRSTIAAPAGKKLVVADLAAIELCVIAWLTGCKFWLDVLDKKLDPYKAFGVHLFRKAYDLITKKERTDSKPAVLGSGYRMGGGELRGVYPDQHRTGLWGYAQNMGIDLSRKQSHEATTIYRDLSPEVKEFWYAIENATMDAIRTLEPQRAGMLVIDMKRPFLRIRLPSGRYLFYCRPRIEEVVVLTGRMVSMDPKQFDEFGDEVLTEESFKKWSMTFEGMDQTTNKWRRTSTHGGVLTENVVQAIARDVLMAGIKNAHKRGFEVVGHVHDEIIALQDEDGDLGVEELIACMTDMPGWAATLPISAAGYENDFYKKD